jgi:hypothetical protein
LILVSPVEGETLEAMMSAKSERPTNMVSIALCCNNPDNGTFRGKFDNVKIGEELLDLDNLYYPPKEPKLSYRFKTTQEVRGFGPDGVRGHIKVSRRRFPIVGFKYGWGNWCWDLVVVTPEVAIQFINYLKELKYFQPDSGEEFMLETFEHPDTRFDEQHIPLLQKYGYQRP